MSSSVGVLDTAGVEAELDQQMHHFLLRFSAALVLTSALGCARSSSGGEAPPSNDDPCADADIAVTKVWSEETKIEVRAQVMEWGGEVGVDVAKKKASEITNSMDRLTDDWARMRRAVCGDYFRRKMLSKEEYKLRVDCLDEMLSKQRAFVTSLESPQADVSASLNELSSHLGECR